VFKIVGDLDLQILTDVVTMAMTFRS